MITGGGPHSVRIRQVEHGFQDGASPRIVRVGFPGLALHLARLFSRQLRRDPDAQVPRARMGWAAAWRAAVTPSGWGLLCQLPIWSDCLSAGLRREAGRAVPTQSGPLFKFFSCHAAVIDLPLDRMSFHRHNLSMFPIRASATIGQTTASHGGSYAGGAALT